MDQQLGDRNQTCFRVSQVELVPQDCQLPQSPSSWASVSVQKLVAEIRPRIEGTGEKAYYFLIHDRASLQPWLLHLLSLLTSSFEAEQRV